MRSKINIVASNGYSVSSLLRWQEIVMPLVLCIELSLYCRHARCFCVQSLACEFTWVQDCPLQVLHYCYHIVMRRSCAMKRRPSVCQQFCNIFCVAANALFQAENQCHICTLHESTHFQVLNQERTWKILCLSFYAFCSSASDVTAGAVCTIGVHCYHCSMTYAPCLCMAFLLYMPMALHLTLVTDFRV